MKTLWQFHFMFKLIILACAVFSGNNNKMIFQEHTTPVMFDLLQNTCLNACLHNFCHHMVSAIHSEFWTLPVIPLWLHHSCPMLISFKLADILANFLWQIIQMSQICQYLRAKLNAYLFAKTRLYWEHNCLWKQGYTECIIVCENRAIMSA